jgi:hypothetical protein
MARALLTETVLRIGKNLISKLQHYDLAIGGIFHSIILGGCN